MATGNGQLVTLTESIKEALLSAANDPDELDRALKENSASKGPFYAALARATAILTEKLKTTVQECDQSEKLLQETQQKIKGAQAQFSGIGKQVADKTKQLSGLGEKLGESKEVLDRAQSLAGLGFGPDELACLHDCLVKIAATGGAKPEEAVPWFFKHVAGYEKLVGIKCEAKRARVAARQAKAEAERWQAEAKAAEASCRARKAAIDFAEKFLAQGVRDGDLPQWAFILSKAGILPENLASALGEYASLDQLCRDLEKHSRKLDRQVQELTGQVDDLKKTRQQVSSAISAVQEKAVAELEKTSARALENLNTLLQKSLEYGNLERQAGTLGEEIALARILRNRDPEQWETVSRTAIMELLMGALAWCRADDHNRPLPAPPRALDWRLLVYPSADIRLADILVWALSSHVEHERLALKGGR